MGITAREALKAFRNASWPDSVAFEGPYRFRGYDLDAEGHPNIVALLRELGAKPPTVEPISGLLEEADPSRGKELYFALGPQNCAKCHIIEKGAVDHKYDGAYEGPNLWGIVGRDRAGVEGYDYSEQMSQLDGSWTVTELNAFIASAVDYLPGTLMWQAGITDARDRADLISFLLQNSD